MPTGACGIHCDACGLHVSGKCSTCGPGRSREAQIKIEAQERILGAPCPVLNCAHRRGIAWCSRDCLRFPCGLFRQGPYPYAEGFLAMQERRRREMEMPTSALSNPIAAPSEYWKALQERRLQEVLDNSLAAPFGDKGLLLNFLGQELFVDAAERSVKRTKETFRQNLSQPLVELVCLVYLLHAQPEGLSHDLVASQELKSSQFFKGPHALDAGGVLRRYGQDLEAFRKAARTLGGVALNMADAAYRIPALPKVPLYYLLWEGDAEFEPRLSILFDRSVEQHLPPDALWALVRLASDALIQAGEPSFRDGAEPFPSC